VCERGWWFEISAGWVVCEWGHWFGFRLGLGSGLGLGTAGGV
jgi:hypothetical protein